MKSAIPRTATLAWSPAALQSQAPYIATGTVAGALDESFSNESVLELWQPPYDGTRNAGVLKPISSVPTSARFNRLAWGYVHSSRPKGLLAAGLENGELGMWDAAALVDGDVKEDTQIMRNTTHTGPVRGLDFNSVQTNLLASGAVNGEIYIWDLNSPGKPYSPGARSQKLDEITSLAWNGQVPHVLATSSSSGYTVVWDLKSKREVVGLAYGGGAGTAGGGLGASGMNGMGGALAAGGRRGMGAVCWHPDTPTRLITASDDDSSPIIMLWDLRNSRAPEKILTGHEKGVLSVSWCKQDADLLLSCGKDNRTICWNPQTCEIIGELPPSSNWSFEVQWSPRNPDLLATASYDGTIGVHSLQATNVDETQAAAPAPSADGADIFDLPTQTEGGSRGLSLRQPPKWLRKPISATFGFGGQLVSTSNLAGPSGKTQSSVVHLRNVVTEPSIVQRATRLQEALESQTLAAFCDERSKETSNKPDEVANWKALQTLFQADSRDELVALLGFSKEEVASKVANAIDAFKTHTGGSSGSVKTSSSAGAQTSGSATVSEENESVPHEPSVTFAEQPNEASSESTTSAGPDAPSEVSGMSDANKAAESETTEPSLFGDDAVNVGGVDAAGADFFNSISGEGGAGARSALPERVLVPHANIAPGSSVAATAGSPGPSSIASENIKASTFRIYPSEESEADKLITRALVLGDFESAVSLCISSDRFADALLLAVRGGSDLLAKTQKAYFEKRTTTLPYLRLFQSIVSDDLTDVVQNADLNEWQEIFVVLCTFAKPDEFSNLAEQLGQRLEFQYASVRAAAGPADTANATKAKEFRKDAVLCYLAGGKLEKVAGMWIDEMKEEEAAIRSGQKTDVSEGSLYSARAEALQTFMEKITVFQNAVGYVDVDLQLPTESDIVAQTGARSYKLAALYDRIHEYVDLLSDQGLVEPALKYVNQTPADYRGGRTVGASTGDATADAARERLVQAGAARGIAKPAAPAAATASSSSYAPYDPYASARPAVPAAPSVPAAPLVNNSLDPYASAMPAAQPYAPAAPMSYAQPAQQQQPAYGGYSQPNAYSQPSVPSAYAPQSQPMVPPPPPMASQNLNAALPPPPPIKRDNSGWNDVPSDLAGPRRTTSAMGTKAQPITSPFPNSPAPSHPFGAQPGGALPPPPRGPTPSRSFASPPPQGPPGSGQYGPRPGAQQMGPPPVGRLGQGPVGPQAPPRGPGPQGSMPPSGPYGPAPTQMNAGPPQGPPGPYGPGPQRASQPSPAPGPYGPQPGMQGPLRPPTMVGPAGPGVPPGPPGPPGPPRIGTPAGGPIPGAGAGAPPRSATPSSKAAAPQSKYPPGDRSHIPEASKPVFNVLSRELQRLRQNSPPQQKRMVDDTERRLNVLFDALNCDMVEPKALQQLQQLVHAIEARNQQAALSIHLQLATAASGELGAALVGVKMLISRM